MSTTCFLLKTYAKINLTLDIVGVRKDGMHLLNSIVSFINIFDTMLVKIGFNRHISFIPHPIENSTVHKLLDLLNIPMSIMVYKHIPIGRGLGGSSSNAGGLLASLVHLGIINKDTATNIAPKIGADVTMYLYHSPMIMEGIGEKITPAPGLPIPEHLYLIIPDFPSPTPLIYRAWDEQPIITNFTDRFSKDHVMGNALSIPFSKVFGINIPQGATLTGSGSSMISISVPNDIPPSWDIIEITTRDTGWEMIPYEC